MNPERVVEQLDEAQQWFAANNDEWDAAWVLFLRGDVEVDRGEPEAAVATIDQIAGNLRELEDSELAANCHRVHGDAAWTRGEYDHAFDCYARAALHAYQFQFTIPNPH